MYIGWCKLEHAVPPPPATQMPACAQGAHLTTKHWSLCHHLWPFLPLLLLPLPIHKKRPSVAPADGDSSRRPRRDHCPKWTLQETLALVDAKREEYINELDTIDACDLMDPDVTKWTHISEKFMAVGYSPCFHDHAMCKSKWHLIILEYRRIADYHSRTGTNKEVYWSQSSHEHLQEGL
jgi:hypothetical protein